MMIGRIREYMEEGFITALPTDTLEDVLDRMIHNEAEVCVILGAGQHFSSIITASQIIANRNVDLSKAYVNDYGGLPWQRTMQLDNFMEDAVRIIEEFHNIDEIIVLDNQRPVGILTKQNILRWIKEQKSK